MDYLSEANALFFAENYLAYLAHVFLILQTTLEPFFEWMDPTSLVLGYVVHGKNYDNLDILGEMDSAIIPVLLFLAFRIDFGLHIELLPGYTPVHYTVDFQSLPQDSLRNQACLFCMFLVWFAYLLRTMHCMYPSYPMSSKRDNAVLDSMVLTGLDTNLEDHFYKHPMNMTSIGFAYHVRILGHIVPNFAKSPIWTDDQVHIELNHNLEALDAMSKTCHFGDFFDTRLRKIVLGIVRHHRTF